MSVDVRTRREIPYRPKGGVVRQDVFQLVKGVRIPLWGTGGVGVTMCTSVGITSREGTVDQEHIL